MVLLKNVLLEDSPADILISGKYIHKVSREPLEVPEAEVIDCSGKAVIPGFVNAHTHAAMIMLRGINEDLTLYKWLERVWKTEARMDGDFIYHGTRAACLEMIKSGTTTFNDQYWFPSHARRAAVEMGLRPVVSFIFLDSQNPATARMQRSACERLYEKSLEWGTESLFTISIHSVYTVTQENILWAAKFARDRGLRIHMHLAETAMEDADCRANHKGLSPTEYFNSLGVLGPDVIAAHCLFLSDEDVRILGRHKVSCVHNVNSNLKLASGYQFRFQELAQAGANVCLGTDGAASSNTVDMLEHMKTCALVQKAWRGDPAAMPLNQLLESATLNGAKALGLASGLIKEGFLADLSLIDLDNSAFISPGSTLANLVYAAHSNVITDVMAGGKWVMRGREVPGEKEIISCARQALKLI